MRLVGRINFVSVPQNTETQIVGPNDKRWLLLVTTDNAGPVYLRNDKLGNVVGGVNIVNTSGQYEFPKLKYGDFLNNPFFIYHNIAAAVIVGFIEVVFWGDYGEPAGRWASDVLGDLLGA